MRNRYSLTREKPAIFLGKLSNFEPLLEHYQGETHGTTKCMAVVLASRLLDSGRVDFKHDPNRAINENI